MPRSSPVDLFEEVKPAARAELAELDLVDALELEGVGAAGLFAELHALRRRSVAIRAIYAFGDWPPVAR